MGCCNSLFCCASQSDIVRRISINIVAIEALETMSFSVLPPFLILDLQKIQKIPIITTFLIMFSCIACFAVYSNDCSI
jgi:hypothetical protein